MWSVWVVSPSLFMERKQKHQEQEAEKPRPVMYCWFCNNILEVVFLSRGYEQYSPGGLLLSRWWQHSDGFAFEAPIWKPLEQEWVTCTGHRMDSLSLSLSLSHIHTHFVHAYEHALKHTEDTTVLLVPYPQLYAERLQLFNKDVFWKHKQFFLVCSYCLLLLLSLMDWVVMIFMRKGCLCASYWLPLSHYF